MEIHGIKIDFIGLAACLTAVGSLYTLIMGQKKKEDSNARKAGTGTDEKIKPSV